MVADDPRQAIRMLVRRFGDLAARRTQAVCARKNLVADLVLDMRRCDRELDQLRGRAADAVDASGTTLLEVYGVGPIVAALIPGCAGDPARFATKERFASYNGTAPIEASSVSEGSPPIEPRGNRKLNHMHLIAVTQVRNAAPPAACSTTASSPREDEEGSFPRLEARRL